MENTLGLLTIGLVRMLRHEHTRAYCDMIQAVAGAEDQQQQLGHLLQVRT